MAIDLKKIYANGEVYPPQDQVFRAFRTHAVGKSKAVIIGQDPYHGPGQANGLAFSVNKGQKLPPSLKNMFKELHEDLGVDLPEHGDLTSWAEQGVVLLNTILTVERGKPLSHADMGWEEMTKFLVHCINITDKPIVFLLWGKKAQEYKSQITNPIHLILEAAHPSPFSAHRGFFGSKPFSKTNEFLIACGREPIDWRL